MKKTITLLLVLCISVLYTIGQDPGTRVNSTNSNFVSNGLLEIYSITGDYTLSADGAGSVNGPYTVDVDKPAGATVVKAYLMAASTGFSLYSVPDNCVSLNAVGLPWDVSIPNGISSYNHYADVTSIIGPVIDAAGSGITSYTVGECNLYDVEGVALLVVFSDPGADEKTIVIMFGALSTAGDNFAITLGTAIDPNEPGALFDMGLGITFGFQNPDQYSIIDVNGTRLTTAAGGADDAQGGPTNGNLITVGGIGDSNTNPTDPYALPVDHYSDDELYSLLPIINASTTNVLVETNNPSDDDNIFLSYFEISGAAIIGEGIVISQTQNTENVGANHDVEALVQDVLGAPVVGTMVDFEVASGPHAGTTHSELTDASGKAYFTYTGTAVGTDEIQACFTDSQSVYQCSNTLSVEWIDPAPQVPISNWAIIIAVLLIGTAIWFRRFR